MSSAKGRAGPAIDWEAIEREYRAGQLSIREIAAQHSITDRAIRKRASANKWTRALSKEVREAVREKLVLEDASCAGCSADGSGSAEGPHSQRADDQEIVKAAAERGFAVITSHRKDLQQLHGLKRVLADRLAMHLQGLEPDGPCLGRAESPGDLLEKLARVTSRLIPLERQAFNLDNEAVTVPGAGELKISFV